MAVVGIMDGLIVGEPVGSLARWFVSASFSIVVEEVGCRVVGVSVGTDVGGFVSTVVGEAFGDLGCIFDGVFVGVTVGNFGVIIVAVLVCKSVGGHVGPFDGIVVGGLVRPFFEEKGGRSLAVCVGDSLGEIVGFLVGVLVGTDGGIIFGSELGVIVGESVFVSAGRKVFKVVGITFGEIVGIHVENFTWTCDGNTNGILIDASLDMFDRGLVGDWAGESVVFLMGI